LFGCLDAVEFAFLLGGLEATMSHLAGGIDEGEGDLFHGDSGCGVDEGFTEDQWSLLGTDTATFDHDVVVVDLTVMWETSQWGNVLFGQIVLGGGIVLDLGAGLTDSVDLLVCFGSVMVTQLTSSWDGESDSFWMPSTDTADLSDTSVGLSWENLCVPSLGDSGEPFTLGDSDNVDHLVLFEELRDLDFFFKESFGEVELLLDVLATVDLDFEDVGLLLAEVELVHLSVGDDTDDLAVFLDSVESGFNVVGSFFGEELHVFGEAFLLGAHPVLVETSLDFLGQMLGPDGGQSSETSGGFDVTNDTDD